jgi:hypothetical protein
VKCSGKEADFAGFFQYDSLSEMSPAVVLSSHPESPPVEIDPKAVVKGSAAMTGWAAIDLLLTMRSDRQLVATSGNDFGLLEPISGLVHLPPVAAGCDR